MKETASLKAALSAAVVFCGTATLAPGSLAAPHNDTHASDLAHHHGDDGHADEHHHVAAHDEHPNDEE